MVPAPGPAGAGGGADQSVVNDFSTLKQQGGGSSSSTSDPANVPLWMIRSEMTNRLTSSTAPALPIDGPQTKSNAQAYWLDMPDSDKRAFAQAAIAADMWKPKDGAFALAQTWAQAVDLAQTYNSQFSSDKDGKWLSPYEAIQKLAPAVAASRGAKYNGFSRTTQVQQFRDSDLYSQAKKILQSDLGRDPTQAELHAFTLAVNAAAAKNPTVTTTQQANPDGTGDNQVVTYGSGAFDPTQTIDDMVKKTDEYARYQAAVDYFPAVMQALGAIV